jgi:hypothetical protein
LSWVVVGGSILECVIFGGFGGYLLWLGIALNGSGVGGVANDLNFLGAAGLLALAAGFGTGALLTSVRWFEARIVGAKIMGAVLHLGGDTCGGVGVYCGGCLPVRRRPELRILVALDSLGNRCWSDCDWHRSSHHLVSAAPTKERTRIILKPHTALADS